MNISIVKLTPSRKQKNLAFMDVNLNDLGLRIKGLKVIQSKTGLIILLPCLSQEIGQKNEKSRPPYSPVTFLSKEAHANFISTIKVQVSKLLNITERNK